MPAGDRNCRSGASPKKELYDDTFGRNVKGVLFTMQKALPLLVDGASVILTGSTASIVAMPAFSVYGASKAAVRSFARHWTLDLKKRRIRVNVLSPGPTKTPGLLGLAGDDRAAQQGLLDQNCRSAGLLIRTRSPVRRCSSRPMTPVSLPAPNCSPMAARRRSERRQGRTAHVGQHGVLPQPHFDGLGANLS
jgi:NAD(P)-dependent dehydrogenase (short-subunit alcohol dehydrogenase family)